MKNLTLFTLLFFATFMVSAQKTVEDRQPVNGQQTLKLDFPFADEIRIETWDKSEVLVEAIVNINDNEDNDLFEIRSSATERRIYMEMDERVWDDRSKKKSKKNCWNSEINIKVFLPKSLEIDAETISGDYELAYYGKPFYFKTVSGDLDLSVDPDADLDFMVKTVTGEVYSDLDLSYPRGKDGLRQIVGMDVEGRLNNGGEILELKTVSGNVFLRSN
ncbi:MAG: hypothetical protein R8G66_30345 [Cytophagales bacterium]|nr:hypothetical protein [Cytophagales bacterium]